MLRSVWLYFENSVSSWTRFPKGKENILFWNCSFNFISKGVKVFDGDFPDDFPKQEDVIALHLCSHSEIVLCLGFDLQEVSVTDPKAKFLAKSYEAAVRAVIKNNLNTQFVFIDHPDELDKSFITLENISCDSYENVLKLLT